MQSWRSIPEYWTGTARAVAQVPGQRFIIRCLAMTVAETDALEEAIREREGDYVYCVQQDRKIRYVERKVRGKVLSDFKDLSPEEPGRKQDRLEREAAGYVG